MNLENMTEKEREEYVASWFEEVTEPSKTFKAFAKLVGFVIGNGIWFLVLYLILKGFF